MEKDSTRESPKGPAESRMSPEESTMCTCKKTKCLKMYCLCFGASRTCNSLCQCTTCCNTIHHGELIHEARKAILMRNPLAFETKFGTQQQRRGSSTNSFAHRQGCHCRKSSCVKKYCECFQHGQGCGQNCRCYNCENVFGKAERANIEDLARPEFVTTAVPRRPVLSPGRKKGAYEVLDAAVAMTQLFGNKEESSTTKVSPQHVSKESPLHAGTAQPQQAKRPIEASPTTNEAPINQPKKLKPASPTDREVKHVISYTGSASHEMNPSPTNYPQGSMPPFYQHQYQPQPTPFGYFVPYAMMPRPYSAAQQPSHVKQQYDRSHFPQHAHSRATHPHYPMLRPQEDTGASTSFEPSHHHRPTTATPKSVVKQTAHVTPATEELQRSLPRALSFRKICSKCGRTRADHGDAGFGNGCPFLHCGKCGATAEAHRNAGKSMGFNCSLTVEQGADPGASDGYDRKIRDLAHRAELSRQHGLQRHFMNHKSAST